MNKDGLTHVIRPLESENHIRACAEMMSGNEPWITLGRTYETSLKLLRDPIREVYLALEGDDVLGYVMLVMTGALVGYIQSLVVAANRRGQGIGAQLMHFAENRIFRDSPNVFICVSSFNPRAQTFYQRLGYQTVGELHNYIVPGHSEFLLRKTLGPTSEFKRTTD